MFVMTGASCYLKGLLGPPSMRAGFVGRVPGVEVTRDKWETLRALEPAHREAVRGVGFGWEDLWRAEQVHGAELAVVPRGGAEGRPMAEADRIVAGVDGLLTGQAGVLMVTGIAG